MVCSAYMLTCCKNRIMKETLTYYKKVFYQIGKNMKRFYTLQADKVD